MPTKTKRIQRPLLCAGTPLHQRKLASARLPYRQHNGLPPVSFELGEQKPAYLAMFNLALKYSPEQAMEALAMVMSACMRTMQKESYRTGIVDMKSGQDMVLEVKLIQPKAGKKK